MTTENTHLNDLMQIYSLTVLIKELTCCHFLTNQKILFKHCQTFEIDLSNHLKLISTIMKSGFFKVPPKKKFGNECFRNGLREELET